MTWGSVVVSGKKQKEVIQEFSRKKPKYKIHYIACVKRPSKYEEGLYRIHWTKGEKNPIEHLSSGSSLRRKTSGMVKVKSYTRRATKRRR